ncbi:MAG: RDD family protein, partial [Tepidisphaeraceae bacterium]
QTPMPYFQTVQYAGFWRRWAAIFIDGILVDFVTVPLSLAMGVPFFARPGANPALAFSANRLMFQLLNLLILWLYFSLMESSKYQATVGKMALSIIVTDLDGKPIGFGQATGRFFGKILSYITLCIGFMMAGWTEKKQALHDFLASTLVICKP